MDEQEESSAARNQRRGRSLGLYSIFEYRGRTQIQQDQPAESQGKERIIRSIIRRHSRHKQTGKQENHNRRRLELEAGLCEEVQGQRLLLLVVVHFEFRLQQRHSVHCLRQAIQVLQSDFESLEKRKRAHGVRTRKVSTRETRRASQIQWRSRYHSSELVHVFSETIVLVAFRTANAHSDCDCLQACGEEVFETRGGCDYVKSSSRRNQFEFCLLGVARAAHKTKRLRCLIVKGKLYFQTDSLSQS